MANKPFTLNVPTAKDDEVFNIMQTAFMANQSSEHLISVEYSPLTDALKVVISESKEKYNDWLYELRIYVGKSSLVQLYEFQSTLVDLLKGEEVDIESTNPDFYGNGLSGIQLYDHRDDPPYVYEEDEDGLS